MAIRNGWYLLARPASNLSRSNPSTAARRYLSGHPPSLFSPAHALANRGAAFCLSSLRRPVFFSLGLLRVCTAPVLPRHLKIVPAQRCDSPLSRPLSGASASPHDTKTLSTLRREAAALPLLWADQTWGSRTALPAYQQPGARSLHPRSVSDTARFGTGAPEFHRGLPVPQPTPPPEDPSVLLDSSILFISRPLLAAFLSRVLIAAHIGA